MRRIIVALAGLAAGCSGLDVAHDYDRDQDFSRLRTWSWNPEGPRTGGSVDTLSRERIERAVERELAREGLSPAGSEEADVWVRAYAGTARRLEPDPVYHGRGYYAQNWRVVNEGGLEVALIDPRDQRVIWRGTARGAIDRNATPEEREERIREAVEKIFEAYPPAR